jgi:hypothetical protein
MADGAVDATTDRAMDRAGDRVVGSAKVRGIVIGSYNNTCASKRKLRKLTRLTCMRCTRAMGGPPDRNGTGIGKGVRQGIGSGVRQGACKRASGAAAWGPGRWHGLGVPPSVKERRGGGTRERTTGGAPGSPRTVAWTCLLVCMRSMGARTCQWPTKGACGRVARLAVRRRGARAATGVHVCVRVRCASPSAPPTVLCARCAACCAGAGGGRG